MRNICHQKHLLLCRHSLMQICNNKNGYKNAAIYLNMNNVFKLNTSFVTMRGSHTILLRIHSRK